MGRAKRPQSHTPPNPAPLAGTVQFPRFLTPDETADLLRTTRQAIYAQIRKGTLPGVIRLRRRILIDGQALLSWLDRNRAVSLQSEGA